MKAVNMETLFSQSVALRDAIASAVDQSDVAGKMAIVVQSVESWATDNATVGKPNASYGAKTCGGSARIQWKSALCVPGWIHSAAVWIAKLDEHGCKVEQVTLPAFVKTWLAAR